MKNLRTIKLPKYIVLEKITNTSTETFCNCCSRPLLHPNHIKNTETNETFYLGSTCTKNYLGLSIGEINDENEEYTKLVNEAEAFEREATTKRTFIETFKELNPEMMEYIENNQDNTFIYDMKRRVEEKGTLTNGMYSTIYAMMLPVAELPEKVKDLEFKVIKFSKKESFYGISYTLLGEVNGELIRIFFSSMNKKHNDLFLDNRIYDMEGFISSNLIDRDLHFKVSGSFDGYKIKRAKVIEILKEKLVC